MVTPYSQFANEQLFVKRCATKTVDTKKYANKKGTAQRLGRQYYDKAPGRPDTVLDRSSTELSTKIVDILFDQSVCLPPLETRL